MRGLRRLRRDFRCYADACAAGVACLLGSNLLATLGPRFIALGGGLLRFGMRYLINGASRHLETDLRNDLFGGLIGLSAPFHQRYPVGDLMARATYDLLALRMVAGPAVMYLVDTSVRTMMIVPMMAAISPTLMLLALPPTLGLPLVTT